MITDNILYGFIGNLGRNASILTSCLLFLYDPRLTVFTLKLLINSCYWDIMIERLPDTTGSEHSLTGDGTIKL